jgi:hypothetical protein
MTRPRSLRPLLATGAMLAASLLLPATARSAEIGIFLSGASPGDAWAGGFGGTLTITLFNVVGAEIEGAKQSGELDGALWTLQGKAYLAPSIGRLVPYVGVGAGVYLESRPGDDDQGTLGTVFAGAKLKFPIGLVVRAEYQWVSLPEAAPVPMDHRYYLGAGLGF